MQIISYIIKQFLLWAIRYACSFVVALGLMNAGMSAFILLTYILSEHGIALFPVDHFFKITIQNNTTTQYKITNEFIVQGMQAQALVALVVTYLHHFHEFIKRKSFTKLKFWASLKIYAMLDFALALLGIVFGVVLAIDGHPHPFSFAFYSLMLILPLLFLQAGGLFGLTLFDDIAEQEEEVVFSETI